MLALLPSMAGADGGVPLLLFFSVSAFVRGSAWIFASETVFLIIVSKGSIWHSLVAVLCANIASTVLVGFLMPAVVVLVGMALTAVLPGPIGDYILALLGLGYFVDAEFAKFAPVILGCWAVISFVLTVYCEGLVYRRYWRRRGLVPSFNVSRFLWFSNLISYAGMLYIAASHWFRW